MAPFVYVCTMRSRLLDHTHWNQEKKQTLLSPIRLFLLTLEIRTWDSIGYYYTPEWGQVTWKIEDGQPSPYEEKKNRESWCAERKKQRCWGEKGERMSSIWKREPERYLIHESFLVLGSRLLATQIGSGISRWLGSGQRKKANSKSQVRNIGRYIPSSLDGVAWRHEMC